jgi:RNA polymerase sigma-70 factor (ECF subfamily)
MTLSDIDRLQSAADEADVAFEMDEDAFRAFYDRTSRALWAYLSRMTGDGHAADDLLQESYYRFLRTRVDYESEAHRRNYLFRIATNLVRDSRRRQHTRGIMVDQDCETLPDSGDLAAASARRTDLHRAMAQLNGSVDGWRTRRALLTETSDVLGSNGKRNRVQGPPQLAGILARAGGRS